MNRRWLQHFHKWPTIRVLERMSLLTLPSNFISQQILKNHIKQNQILKTSKAYFAPG